MKSSQYVFIANLLTLDQVHEVLRVIFKHLMNPLRDAVYVA